MNLDLTRRNFLRSAGLGAGSLALAPIVQQLQARASGIAPKMPRFVFVVESNGVPPQQMAPSGIERKARRQSPLNGPAEFIDESLTNRDLPFSLEPITPWKDKVTIIQGLSGKVCGGGHSNNYQALGCFSGQGESTAIQGETVDGALAKHIGCLLYTSPSPRDGLLSRMPSSA